MKDKKILITKSFLPSKDKYISYINKIWENHQLTNSGPFTIELEKKIQKYLKCGFISSVNNGTTALQIAIEALDLKNEIITTPFSYIATSSSILWQKCKPVYADICPKTLNIDPENIEKLINEKTTGIIVTHVFGNPCDISAIKKIAKKYNLKVIYDAAHAFGVKYKNNSILKYGDISILSFHATKIFHSIEGGALISQKSSVNKKIQYLRNFGHDGEEKFKYVGINGKLSEMHAAMGLCVLENIDEIISYRKNIYEFYEKLVSKINFITRPLIVDNTQYNYSYYPIILQNEKQLKKVKRNLNNNDIYPRRYFYPSLNKLGLSSYKDCNCPISEDVSKKILCLPMSTYLKEEDIRKIIKIIKESF